MNRILTFLIAGAMTLGSLAARATGDSKAAELLAQARAAIGGERTVSNVKGLSCTGTVRRQLGDRQVSGELTLDLRLPDKMVRTEAISPMNDGALVITEQGIRGDTLVRSTRTMNAPPGIMIRTPPPPAAGSDAEAQALRNSRAELTRMTLALLPGASAALPVEYTYQGEAESPDGKADVVETRGPNNFSARLFFDKQTHRLLMMTYRGASPRLVVQARRLEAPPPADHGDAPAQPPAPEIVDIAMFFDDYRTVEGLALPHHISRAVDGETTEEWTFKTIRVNPN
jgi:hypothetical protein